MDQILKDKTALITGSGSGIGQTLAVGFAKLGANIIITDMSEEGMQTTKKMVEDTGAKAITIKANVQEYEEVKKVIEAGIAAFGKINILINNAGFSRLRRIQKMPIEEAHAILKTNILGVYNFTHAIVPHMEANGGGAIVNTGSLTVKNPSPKWGTYAMSKSALLSFTEHFGVELKDVKISINTLMPMMVNTPLFRMGMTEEDIKRLNPMEPTALIPYYAFFATEDSKKVTGLNVDIEIIRSIISLKEKVPPEQQGDISWKVLEPIAEQNLPPMDFKDAKKYRRITDFILKWKD
jgi:NAD(P)-dependent dehydrogenase (short-subunit alcohol dehydrogenase family)